MNTFIAMLRGINVSGQKKIRMAELKNLFSALGLVNIRTYLQSGNVVFDCSEPDTTQLTPSIEAQIAKTFGYAIPVFIRTKTDLQQIIAGNPFSSNRKEEPAALYATFLYDAQTDAHLLIPANEDYGGDEFLIQGRTIYLFCPNGYGRTKLSNTFFEKKLKVAATTRNWKTVTALSAMA